MISTIGFIALYLLERVRGLQFEPIPVFRKYLLADVAYYFQHLAFNAAANFILGSLLGLYALSRGQYSELSPFFVFMVSFVATDFFAFFVHWLLHQFDGGWRFHQIHHSVLYLDAWSAYRGHVFAQVCYLAANVLCIYALIGWLRWPPKFVILGVMLPHIWTVFNHCNLVFKESSWLTRALGKIVVFPETHRLHHMESYFNKNFGTTLTVWDRIWGTYLAPEHATKTPIGFPQENQFPQSFLQQLLHPFRSS